MDQIDTGYERLQPISLEEIRRQARENWLALRQQNTGAAKVSDPSFKKNSKRIKDERSHSIDDEINE